MAVLTWFALSFRSLLDVSDGNGGSDTSQGQEAPPGTDSKRSPDKAAQHVVNPDASVTPALTGQEAEQWQNFVHLIGAQRVVAKIETVEFYANPDDDTMASVARTSEDGVHFDLQVNLAYAGKGQEKELAHTYIHEFSHTMSLSSDQVPEVSGKCPRLKMEEGCALSTSYINQFRDQFWERYGFTTPSKSGDQEKITTFYDKHRGDFVTDYAASSVTEDYAESFTAWVMERKAPGGGLVAEKFAFFDRFPELVAFREDVRTRLDPAWVN